MLQQQQQKHPIYQLILMRQYGVEHLLQTANCKQIKKKCTKHTHRSIALSMLFI